LGAGLTIEPRKKVIVTKPQRGGQGRNWAVKPYDDDTMIMAYLFVVYLTTLFSNYIQSNKRVKGK
jgi:hypothetical protein